MCVCGECVCVWCVSVCCVCVWACCMYVCVCGVCCEVPILSSPPQASPTLVVNHFTMANVLAAQVGGVALVTCCHCNVSALLD